jgi:hypothetical protein
VADTLDEAKAAFGAAREWRPRTVRKPPLSKECGPPLETHFIGELLEVLEGKFQSERARW